MPTQQRKARRDPKIPKILMPLIPRRSDEPNDEFEREFNARIMEMFLDNRKINVEEFKKECENFIKDVKIEFIWGESGTSKYVTLTRLMKVLQKSPKEIRDLFPIGIVSTFVRITNFNRTIDIKLIEELVKTVTHAEELYIKLLPFAENSTEISSYSLQEFITSQYVPTMVEEPERADYYSAYATGLIFFLLDARRREYVFLKDLLASTLLMHLEECINAENNCLELPEVDIFTVAQFRSTLHEFRCLDTDRNGVLSPQEMRFFREGYFNSVFIQRIFDISLTYEKGCLDFKGFVDLVAATHFRHTKASAKYHFEALDLKEDGVLDEDEIRTATFFQAQLLPEYTEDAVVNTDIVTAELKDMIRLKKNGITLDDFVGNRMSATFTGYLSNYTDFMRYERREL